MYNIKSVHFWVSVRGDNIGPNVSVTMLEESEYLVSRIFFPEQKWPQHPRSARKLVLPTYQRRVYNLARAQKDVS
jgi:hypothetical protein